MGRTANDVINVMASWVGYNESNGKFKEIIDIYNNDKPLPRGYKVKYTDEWCDTGLSAAFIKAGCKDLSGKECGCEEHVKIFKEMGIWIEDGTITPERGYVIVYNWDTKTQPNNGYSDHIGLVETVSNGQITVLECNKSSAVGRRVISVGNGQIRGYASPKYEVATSGGSGSTGSSGTTLNREVTWYGLVTASALYVRTWAGTENDPLQSYPKISKGTVVGVCDTVNDNSGDPWYYIVIDGDKGKKYGFSSAAYIKQQSTSDSGSSNTSSSSSGELNRNTNWTGKVTASALFVRTWAGTEYPTIKSYPKLYKGTTVDVCDEVYANDGSKWYYIRINGKVYGFSHSAYITAV